MFRGLSYNTCDSFGCEWSTEQAHKMTFPLLIKSCHIGTEESEGSNELELVNAKEIKSEV
jgi:hypothetical protein